MSSLRPVPALSILAALLCAACSQAPDSTPPTVKAVAPIEDATLEIADRAALDDMLAAHRGNVVLVDYWSTSCVPCVEKLPAVLALQKELRDRGLRVITLSMDDPDAAAEIQAFLRERGAAGRHLISKFGSSPKSLEEFEIDLIPHYRLYNRAGELVETFEPGPDAPPLEFSDIQAAVERLL
ncbi:MAG: TlpA disulfide reductase family protein [Pirellulales bacterium]